MPPLFVIDSHTAGEPTRVIVRGLPDLGEGNVAELRDRFREEHDAFRRSVILEPRGTDVLVGAALVKPVQSESAAGVIFFNNVGFLGMCGHGAMGVVTTLRHLGRIDVGSHWLETPVGNVRCDLRSSGEVTIENVESYRYQSHVRLNVPELGEVTGDVAWGGNWFFITADHKEEISPWNVPRLTSVAKAIREALTSHKILGEHGAEIDHIELNGAPSSPGAHAKNFVLCPGLAFDRSPCGTGTSAKIACLAADGRLAPGESFIQEGILGTTFRGEYSKGTRGVIPRITGKAFVIAETNLLYDKEDPFHEGIIFS